MIPIILALASFNVTNAHDYEVMRFECLPAQVTNGAVTPCNYEYLVIRDEEGKEHRYRLKDVKEQAIKDLKKLEVKKDEK